ncbi:MAG: sigma 54-interacting transcriptional regulator [Syntrophobacteraceae bacterium]|nr:sigma 54-interacting transcriptional regulator [Syntrophobacteraceae bacterium]
MNTVLIVDDERNYLLVLEELLSEEGYQVITAEGARRGLEFIEENDFDVVITDMKMPGMDGIEFMERIKLRLPDIPVIMMTAFGSVEKAVEAMRKGAFDYILKPFKNEELKLTILKALNHYNLVRQNRMMARELQGKYQFGNIIGKSVRMQRIFELIEKVAPARATVLITGDSGTGKELIARAIHYNSPRKDQPFISVNCGALPETLLESELFGHEKGAFTGAVSQRKGRFELAHEGTLFLDEISEMSPPLQVKLLRILQEMEFERVGGSNTLKVDVRVVAASNRNLKEDAASGRFRSDLYYRLNVVHIHLPPLRERKDDLPLLVNHFLAKYAKQALRESIGISSGALERILDYHWPGNVRELENSIERAIILSNGSEIELKDLPYEVRDFSTPPPTNEGKRQTGEDIERFVPELSAGERMHDSGFKVRQVRAMEFIKTNGFITNKYYSQLAEISERQALRELSELVESGRLVRVGKGRACRYVLKGE